MIEIISRKDAIQKGLNTYYTGKTCKRGHLSSRNVKDRVCLDCVASRMKITRRNKKDKIDKGDLPKYYHSKTPCPQGHIGLRSTHTNSCVQCTKDAGKMWKENHKDHTNEYQNNRRKNDPEFRKKWLESNKKHRMENPGYWCAAANKRRAAKLQRTPLWVDFKAIAEIYEESALRTEETGIQHHVDHDIPLQGKFVSGLHIAENLVILEAADNLSKGNSFS